MKNVLVLLFSLVMMVLLIACNGTDSDRISTGNNEQNSQQQEVNTPNPELSQTVDSSEDSGNEECSSLLDNQSAKILQFDSVEDVMRYQNEFFLAGEYTQGYDISDYIYKYDKQNEKLLDMQICSIPYVDLLSRSKVVFAAHLDEQCPVIFDRETGDGLVLIMSQDIGSNILLDRAMDPYTIYKLDFQGYCVPVVWIKTSFPYYEIVHAYSLLVGTSHSGSLNVDEIGGIRIGVGDGNVSPSALTDALETLGYSAYKYNNRLVIVGEYGDSISIGTYEGTVYNGTEYVIETGLYTGYSYAELVPHTTKDGVFTYDLDECEPGLYLFLDRLIEIR